MWSLALDLRLLRIETAIHYFILPTRLETRWPAMPKNMTWLHAF